MQRNDAQIIDKRLARGAFDRAAGSYDQAAVLQREVADRILERLDYIKHVPQRLLDVGCGTGYTLQPLARRYPGSEIWALDVSLNMLDQARRKPTLWQKFRGRFRYVAGDAEQLPLADASVDMIFSSLAVQWCVDLDRTFAEMRRVLKPDGLLMFSTFGPDTLRELRHCFESVDDYSHTNQFIDMHDIGDALLRNGFGDPVMDMEMLTVTYDDVLSIMRDLKQIGAHNVTQGRARGLTGKRRMQAVSEAYEQFRQEQRLPVSYEVLYGHAWAMESAGEGCAVPQSVNVSFDAGRS
ncbi:malonyl-ACP O-methyltransferase BioC [Thiohalophilus thiocyanatoxydans]|uniref:Malonyl-[acyl-carrier protein] O-methyltransferase n=1 Tax=Thiohalophilus thiocyanatoxydans TaxID=381308 RepID=A0A4R8J2J3_9GAMM|nr:malonyl-ACP O-methyltransferase BioC [Thiohalophilus thiocyanatoxydans]TDY04083.1 malonyl-CoA O-methyltransferase [Thiohalophilus thiocyanatoxydans]